MFKPAEGLGKIDNKQPLVIQAPSVRDRTGAAWCILEKVAQITVCERAMEIILVDKPILRSHIQEMAEEQFGDMVKAVVDIEKCVMSVGGGLHADEESYLLERSSRLENLWGINIHPARDLPEMVEFDSLINIRPRQDNRSRYVEDSSIREKVIAIVGKLVQ